MRLNQAGKKEKPFVFSSLTARCAPGLRSALLGFSLIASVGMAGCIGLAGTPGGSLSTGGGGGSAPSGSSQKSQLSPSSAAISFVNITVGSATSELVTLTVAGDENVTISSIKASGTGFSVSGKSNVTLAPNQSLTISVGFKPMAPGASAGKLLVASNASNSNLQIGLSGNGLSASGNHSVALNWLAGSSQVLGYFVFRGSATSNLSQLNAKAVPSTNYTDRTVVSGQTYVYAVKSIDVGNVLSRFSNVVTVKVPNP